MLSAQNIIVKKREGFPNSAEEIQFLIQNFVSEKIPEYQISAWLMACYFKGLSEEETVTLLSAMIASGHSFDWSAVGKPIVDKHSTGGVGDKTSLVILPLLALENLAVPMIAGRGLGHTGGTLDKLESVPGLSVTLNAQKFESLVNSQGGVIAGQTADIVPADKKLYALRDVTGTVEQMGLIVASILSKKIAAGVKHLVLDVKFGDGAFMEKVEDAEKLAQFLVKVGKLKGLHIHAALTNMAEPLGRAAGNALEVDECLDVLCGYGPSDTRDLSLSLAAATVLSAEKKSWDESLLDSTKRKLKNHIDSGRALEKFIEMMCAQGARKEALERTDRSWIDKGVSVFPVSSEASGVINQIATKELGVLLVKMGAGRLKVTDAIQPKVGISQIKKCGENIEKGEPLCFVHLEKENIELIHDIRKCFKVGQPNSQELPLILKWIH